jgi:hypothetical protein
MCPPPRAKKLIARPTFKGFDIISENLTLVEMSKPIIELNKPIYSGFCIHELSKELTYKFHYKHIRKRYGDNATLLFTDTDSRASKRDAGANKYTHLCLLGAQYFRTNYSAKSTVSKLLRHPLLLERKSLQWQIVSSLLFMNI